MIKSGASTVEIISRNQCSLWWVVDDCDEALFMTTIAGSNQKFSESSRFNRPQKMGNLLSVETWAQQWVVLYRLRRPVVHSWLQCGQHPPSSLTGSKVMQLVVVGSAVVTDTLGLIEWAGSMWVIQALAQYSTGAQLAGDLSPLTLAQSCPHYTQTPGKPSQTRLDNV